MSEWVNEWVSEWVKERVSEWVRERASERASKWASEWVSEREKGIGAARSRAPLCYILSCFACASVFRSCANKRVRRIRNAFYINIYIYLYIYLYIYIYIVQLESDIPRSRYDDDVRGVNIRAVRLARQRRAWVLEKYVASPVEFSRSLDLLFIICFSTWRPRAVAPRESADRFTDDRTPSQST